MRILFDTNVFIPRDVTIESMVQIAKGTVSLYLTSKLFTIIKAGQQRHLHAICFDEAIETEEAEWRIAGVAGWGFGLIEDLLVLRANAWWQNSYGGAPAVVCLGAPTVIEEYERQGGADRVPLLKSGGSIGLPPYHATWNPDVCFLVAEEV